MQTAPKLFLLVLGLALLMTLSSAVQVNVTVTNDAGTRLVGTRVQVLVDNTTLYEKNATIQNDAATAVFDVAPGEYFIRLIRSGYPDHVYLVNISQATAYSFTMLDTRSTYSLFGNVAVTPDEWVGKKINLIDSQNTVARSTTIQAGGIFLIDSVWPNTEYHLRLDGARQYNTSDFSYSTTDAHYMEIGTETIPIEVINNTPLLSQVGNVSLYSILSVQLKAGDRPMVGQALVVSTPMGDLNLTTDANGMAYVQSAAGGEYVFTWETQEVKMSVPMPPAPPKSEPVAASNNSSEATPVTQPPATPPSNGTMALGMAGILMLVVIIVIAVVVIVFVAPKMMKASSRSSEKKADAPLPAQAKPAENEAGKTTGIAEVHEHEESLEHKAEHAKHHAAAKHKAHKKK